MKKFLLYLRGWRGITLITYMWLILMAYVIVYVNVSSPEVKKRFYIVSVAEIILLAMIYVCPRLLNYVGNIKINVNADESLTEKQISKFFLRSWLSTFVIFFTMYLIFYLGGFESDSISMYSQALEGKYGDWHPALNTLFSYTLPLRLTGNWKGAPIFFQVMMFSLSVAYMEVTLFKYGNHKYAKRFWIYLMLNPATLTIFLVTPKDSSFSIAILTLMTIAVRIYFTRGHWLDGFFHNVIFIAVITAGTLFRHNGILFTLPMLFGVSVCIKNVMLLYC